LNLSAKSGIWRWLDGEFAAKLFASSELTGVSKLQKLSHFWLPSIPISVNAFSVAGLRMLF
jgi:hypothetical protein